MIRGIFIGLIVAAIILLTTIALIFTKNVSQGSKYSAVYMETGDLYFGELHQFPYTYMTNVWYLQAGAQGQSPTVSRFSESLWGPKDTMRINPDKIIWTTKIAPESQLVRIMGGEATPEESNVSSQDLIDNGIQNQEQ